MWPPGGDAAAGEQLFIGAYDVIAESKRAPVQLNSSSTTAVKPRHCDVTASSYESLLMTSLGQDAIYVIHSGIIIVTMTMFMVLSESISFKPYGLH